MAAITEAALQGQWFYLEEEQPLDFETMHFYVLQGGEVRTGATPEVAGTYIIADGRVVITLQRTVPFTTTITLSSSDLVFDETTDVLSSSATYTLPDGSDPLEVYGSFVRRFADFPTVDDVRKRAG